MRYFRFLCLCIGFILLACKQNETEVGTSIKLINNKPINIELSDIVNNITYVKLETRDECMLGNISYVKYDDGHYFVQDEYGIYSFDENGNFISQIGRKGRASNEYINITTFFLDRYNNRVGIVCNATNKLMYFDYEGCFIETIMLDPDKSNIESAQCLNIQGDILVSYPMKNIYFGDNDMLYCLFKYINGRYEYKPLMSNPDISTGQVQFTHLRYPILNHKEKTYAIGIFSHDVYELQEEKLVQAYTIDYIKPILNINELIRTNKQVSPFELYEKKKKTDCSLGITTMFSNGNYLIYGIDRHTLLFDGQRCVLINDVYDKNYDIYIMGLAQCGGISDENIGHDTAETMLNNLKYGRISNKNLYEMVKGLDIDDNPIVYRYSLKDNIVDYLIEKYNLQ